MRGVCPSTDGKEGFEVPILLLELEERFEVSIEVVSGLVPFVTGVMDILVGPCIGYVYNSRIRAHICESI